MNKVRKLPLATLLPIMLLIGIFLGMLVIVFTQAKVYGHTLDEPLQDSYGRSLLSWYKTLGQDTSFLTAYRPETYMPQHGAAFDALVALAQSILGHPWYTRAVMTGLAGVVGIVGIALCGYELAGWWGAVLAALALCLYPRYYGAIFNNPKDIPFTAAMTWLLWATLLLAKHWGKGRSFFWNCLLVGFFIGFAASIRVTSVIWFAVLVPLLAGWWLFHGLAVWREKQLLKTLLMQAIACILVGFSSLVTMMIFWPYIFLDPFLHLYQSIQLMSNYPWDGPVLFNGIVYPSMHLPRSYVPIWLAISSPIVLMVFVLVGILSIGLLVVRKRILEAKVAVVLCSFLVPLALMVILRAALYDGSRQFLFLVPPMILLAVYGGIKFFSFLTNQRQKLLSLALILLVLASYALVIKDMVDLHPYEYTYFNELIGGVAGADQKYPTDYWGECIKNTSEWLGQNYRHYTNTATPTFQMVPGYEYLAQIYLSSVFRVDKERADFYLVITSAVNGKSVRNTLPYEVIYTEGRQSVPFCVLEFRPPALQQKQ